MILTCPSCGTQYVVKDGAIREGGRQVRCASCKHSWHQDPEELEQGDEAGQPDGDDRADVEGAYAEEDDVGASEPANLAEPDEGPAEPDGYSPVDPIAPSNETMGERPAPEPVATDDYGSEDARPAEGGEWRPAARDDEFSPFADRTSAVEARRSPMRGVLIGLLVLAVLAAAFWFLAPAEWKARVGLAQVTETPLQLMMTHSDRQRLESGNELLAVQGRVINPTDERQPVPPIQAQLRTSSGELVYSWTIAPPAPELGPGASATFNSAEVNVPAGGDELTISLGPPKA